MEQEYSRWLSHVAESDLLSQLQTMSEQERREAFCCDLSFGTGGLRGIVGAGTNRMNIYTVRRATQGLANYLKAQKLPMSAAIAHDSRLYGRTFAETAACVLAANGIKVYLYPRLEPTPALSWAVRRYACGAGICITASHNPAQYNGYKVYGSDGCQITLDAANAIEAEIAVVDCFMDVQTCGYQEACADGRIESIPDSVLDAYINAVYAQRVTDIDCSGLRLVYTPLCGSGLECVQKLLDRLGVADVTVVPSQAKPDGKFPTCPYPNPEIRESMEEGLRLCREKQPELLIGTDPDCDRCGVAARDKDGVNAVLLICQMATMYQKAGVTLPEVLNTLYRTYGWYENGQLVRGVPGANGMERMQAQLTALRKAPPKTLAGMPIEDVWDYADGRDGLPPADMLEFRLVNGRVLLRPSGTEPKLKLYMEVHENDPLQAKISYTALRSACEALL